MTTQIGPYDYQTLHVLPEGSGVFSLFERRLRRVVVTPAGKPKEVLSEDVTQDYVLEVVLRGDRIVEGMVLVPVREQE